MKPLPAAAGLKNHFDRASQAIEARFGDKPVWLKLLVFVPVLIALTAVFMFLMYLVAFGALELTKTLTHH